MIKQTYYTPEEIEQLREQARKANELALVEVRKRSVTVHPRIKAIRDRQQLDRLIAAKKLADSGDGVDITRMTDEEFLNLLKSKNE